MRKWKHPPRGATDDGRNSPGEHQQRSTARYCRSKQPQQQPAGGATWRTAATLLTVAITINLTCAGVSSQGEWCTICPFACSRYGTRRIPCSFLPDPGKLQGFSSSFLNADRATDGLVRFFGPSNRNASRSACTGKSEYECERIVQKV